MEIFVMSLGQTLAPGARFFQRRRSLGDPVALRQRRPATL